jgi:uncharacterized protein YyaL (SSP411 family)
MGADGGAGANEALPAAGLAATRFSEHPVQMALVGDPGDSTVRALREASWFVFEPRKILLSLDPATDTAHLTALGYPAEYAPALFVCVGTVCSPPLTSTEGLAGKVRDIVTLAGGAGR